MESNFIKTIIKEELESKKVNKIITRFPPEPNAFLHIGHARAIIQNFELAKEFNGYTNLRYDDTNPSKEEERFVKGIYEDVKWLGYEPKHVYYASNYFDEMYKRAILLIKKGLAYVDDLSPEEIQEYRGNLTTPGKESPYRNRSIEENLELFENMKKGLYKEGEKTLRAKIDMNNPNMNLRDPVIYRILYQTHHNTKDKWCIYPMYDYAHPLEDAIEGITHSLCSLEFEDHRPLYDWFVLNTEMPHKPRQIEFGRLNLSKTILSKRYLKMLVDNKIVSGYDDPRMPTLSGLRKRGVTPNAIRNFILSTGLSKVNSTTDKSQFEHFIREDLKLTTKRIMGVINPLKVTITNYPDDKIEYLDILNNMENPELGSRKIAFSKHLLIEQEDFLEEKPNKKWKRLSKGIEVRLFGAYFIKCNEVIKDKDNNIIELLCTYDVNTKSGSGFEERKPNGTIHFVEETTAKKAYINLIDDLFIDDDINKDNFLNKINKDSLITKLGYVENLDYSKEESYQFMRNGYYKSYIEDDKVYFNQIVSLKSSFEVKNESK